jgi:hypothetical protein
MLFLVTVFVFERHLFCNYGGEQCVQYDLHIAVQSESWKSTAWWRIVGKHRSTNSRVVVKWRCTM